MSLAVFTHATTLTVNKTYTQTTTLTSLSSVAQISNLSVSGSVVFNQDTSLVRILVRDATGVEYMMYESYPLCATSKSIAFTNEAEETNILKNIKPVSVVVIVKNASVTLQNFVYSTMATAKTSDEILQAQYANIQLKNAGKIARINANQSAYHCEWTAGQTQLASNLFNEKRNIHGYAGDYNTFGLEFYIGGVYSEPATYVSSLKSGTVSQYVDEFDWRKVHNAHLSTSKYYDGDQLGGGWATPIRNQGSCGSCWIFGSVALVEMYANLYLNKHIDLDLSEQNVLSCISKGDCIHGGTEDVALNYIMEDGVVPEEFFPYIGQQQSCSKMISGGNVIKITHSYGSWPMGEDNVKRDLLKFGPMTGGWDNRSGSMGHVMLLVGWKTSITGDVIWIFKNSWGSDHGDGLFYFNPKSETLKEFIICRYLIGPLIGLDEQAQCLDMDGDGYYNWGIGPKPSTCHPNAPDIEDFNDDDPTVAELDKTTGELKAVQPIALCPEKNINPGIQAFEIWNTEQWLCSNVTVKYPIQNTSSANGTIALRGLIIRNKINFLSRTKLTISNSTLKLNGGVIDNASISLSDNATFVIDNGAKVILGGDNSFTINKGTSGTLLNCSFQVK